MSKMSPGMVKSILKSLQDLRNMMHQKMADGEGEEEMSDETLSDVVGEATAAKAPKKDKPGAELPTAEQDEFKADMKRMMNGPPPKASHAPKAMAMAMHNKKAPAPVKKKVS